MRQRQPWDQGLGDDDFVEGVDDEADELGVDFHVTPAYAEPQAPLQDAPARVQARAVVARPVRTPNGQNKRYRIRKMSEKLKARFPNVATMLITRTDGSQVLFVRK